MQQGGDERELIQFMPGSIEVTHSPTLPIPYYGVFVRIPMRTYLWQGSHRLSDGVSSESLRRSWSGAAGHRSSSLRGFRGLSVVVGRGQCGYQIRGIIRLGVLW